MTKIADFLNDIINGFWAAFSMYSVIRVKNVEWNERNLKYMYCFFPFVGVVIGACVFAYIFVCHINELFVLSLGATLIPMLISGGIHIDGFMDTCDALSSHYNRQKIIEIMKDPHIGGFAVIKTIELVIINMLLYYSVCRYGGIGAFVTASVGFVISRCIGGAAVTAWKYAKSDGLAVTLGGNADRKAVLYVFLIYIAVCIIIELVFAGAVMAVTVAILTPALYFYHKRACLNKIGGITGDYAGYIITISESVFAAAAILGSIITGR